MNEQWVRWEPISGLKKEYYIDSISDNMEGFEIILSEAADAKKKIKVIFANSVDAYRSTDESFRRGKLYALSEKYGQKFWAEWTFFKVINSDYLKWLSEQSSGISDSLPFVHFSLITSDSILDIVTTYEPKVELIEDDNK